LVYGKTIIGPNIGSFKDLGKKGLIYTYDSFEDLENRLNGFEPIEGNTRHQVCLQQYISQHSWSAFANFTAKAIYGTKNHHSIAL
jgi:hypothetical protein